MCNIAAKLIAVHEADAASVGAIVLWHLDGEMSLEKLRAEWSARALDTELLPDAPSTERALFRATKRVFAAYAVEPLALDDADVVCAFTVFNKSVNDGRANVHGDIDVILRASADDSCEIVVDVLDGSDDGEAWAGAVAREFDRFASAVTSQDASGFCVELVQACAAVSVKDKGGVYFVPRNEMPRWRAFVAAIEAVSAHKFHSIPAMRADDAVAAVLDALEREALVEIERTDAALSKQLAEGGEIATRSKNARERGLRAIETKLAQYETLLGTRLERVHDAIGKTRTVLTQGALASMDSLDDL